MAGLTCCLVADAKSLIKAYTLATCMSLEVLKAKIMPFHPAAHRHKSPIPGQIRTADCHLHDAGRQQDDRFRTHEVEAVAAEDGERTNRAASTNRSRTPIRSAPRRRSWARSSIP